MATTETGDGHEHVSANQVSSAGVAGAETEGADAESMDKQPEAISDVGGVVHRSAAVEKMKMEEAQCKEDEANTVQPNESISASHVSGKIQNFVDISGGSSASEKEKIEGEPEKRGKNGALLDEGIDTNSGGPHLDEDTHMNTMSDPDKDTKSTAEKMDTDTIGRDGTHREKTDSKVSPVDDLDEMMDIGTVDQVDQEAHMKEDTSVSTDIKQSSLPVVSKTIDSPEEKDAVKQEDDGEPPSFDLKQSNSSSETKVNTGRQGSAAPKSNGMKVVEPPSPKPERMRLRSASRPVKSSPPPPVVQVKDEPVDEEYDRALISSSTASVKDEPSRGDLRIGSVYSVPPAAETQVLPIMNPSSIQMSCYNCKKGLTKGQTAFQRKGSPSLFCSTACLNTSALTGKAVLRNGNKICFNCQKLIFRPQDVIQAPDGKGAMKDFCSQNCLTSFNYKKNTANYRKAAAAAKAQQSTGPQSMCSMCSRHCVSKHEVILSGSVHKLCSDACFNRFRAVNNLSMAGCANCGSCCHNKPVMLKLEDSSKMLCNAECLAKYKEKTQLNQPCKMCNAIRPLADLVDCKNSDDSVNLFCSSSCVMAFKVQTVSSSGSPVICDSCGVNTVPAYHLAMSDMSIRNFCTLPCVMSFQDKFNKSQKRMNIFTKLPVGSTQIQNVSSTQPKQDAKGVQNLNCLQCARSITFKPEIIQIKDKIVFLCSVDCSLEFKKSNYVMGTCEYCKEEKIVREVKRVNHKNCCFCSDGCKLLFRHNLNKSWGKHCHSCVYCHCISKRLVTAQYGGLTEEFCSEECRSKYTMLFCHVEKCDTCGRKGKLRQSLCLLREVKHFCDLNCLLQFCCDKVASQGKVLIAAPGEATPVIANVISLAGSPDKKSDSSEGEKSTVSSSKPSISSGHFGIQTESVKAYTSSPAPQKILKNKALLCKPLVQNKGVSCKTQTADVEAQTEDVLPKVMIVPVPVPVYVPVPMSMYSQCTPNPVGLPLPLPVPMFLPVTMDSAERVVETIQEIKRKIPNDPYEAELILMAEMVAEQDEKKEETTQGEKAADKQEPDVPAPDDHVSNYSDDLDTDDLENFLNNWEDASSDMGLRSPSQPPVAEKLNSMMNVTVELQREPTPEAPPLGPPPGTPPLDIEEDFDVETLEKMAQLREHSPKANSPPPNAVAGRRRQAQRKARDKRGKKLQRLSKASDETSPRASSIPASSMNPKLRRQYGIDAWKRWIRWRKTQPNVEKPRYGPHLMELKEDILHCSTAELSYGLCCFITEVKRPNGESYSTDTLFYLCLGIQQYLFENGRVENIFMDRFYSKFSNDFTNMLRGFKPTITPSGYVHSRVEEEFLWDCKQLGAYSPIVLLNTLLFFCCKYFGFTTVQEHRQLSFAHVMRCTKTNANNTKTTVLRFYPPLSLVESESDVEVVAAKRRREEDSKDILEMMENSGNPLRCPVRLYEFYLSKCSDSVKQRTNVFYLHPERCCVPNSPLWFSSVPLDDATMEAMLVRILTVRELHVGGRRKSGAASKKCNDPAYIPDGEDEDSE